MEIKKRTPSYDISKQEKVYQTYLLPNNITSLIDFSFLFLITVSEQIQKNAQK